MFEFKSLEATLSPDCQAWDLPYDMASMLKTFVGFERMIITARLRSYNIEIYGWRTRPDDSQIEHYINTMQYELGPWLCPVIFKTMDDGNVTEELGEAFGTILFSNIVREQLCS